jgi:taurine dioxygenase
VHPFYSGHEDVPEVMILEHDAARRANSDRWHNDVTYLATPPFAGVLYAEEIPELGGDTLWANMYLAYESLSDPVKQLVSELRAVHSFAKNFTPQRFAALGMEDRRDAMYQQHPPVSHPVARTNPATGRKALFVNQDFTSHIEGVTERESDALLRFLFDHMAQPEFQVRWRWEPRTVAMWDNRWAQHCALADYYPARRRMRRATVLGERPV